MGRSPILIMSLLSALSLAADVPIDGTESITYASPPMVLFDASAYIGRTDGVDVATLPNINRSAVVTVSPSETASVQSVPLPPAVFGVASLGIGWIMIRSARLARRRFGHRRH